MPTITSRPKLAVLIDAENARAAHAPQLMQIIGQYGKPIIQRAYGDWTTTQLTRWKNLLNALSIRPFQQFRYARHKNSSDAALLMDAMELLYTRSDLDGFCIVSSDSDYIGLAARIRERGLMAYGFGDRTTMRAFVAACDEFIYLDEVCSQAAPDAPDSR
ncbi:MAG: NYN domain-containing protein [Pseudomonadota bacterium]